MTFSRTVWATVVLNGVCMVFIVSQRKAHSTLHPETVESWVASIGWSYCGVNSIAKTFQVAIQPINVAHIKVIFEAVGNADGDVEC